MFILFKYSTFCWNLLFPSKKKKKKNRRKNMRSRKWMNVEVAWILHKGFIEEWEKLFLERKMTAGKSEREMLLCNLADSWISWLGALLICCSSWKKKKKKKKKKKERRKKKKWRVRFQILKEKKMNKNK